MKRLQYSCFVLAIALTTSVSVHGQSLYMVSEEWEGATNADGSGLFWDIMREVYEPEGYEVKLDVFPYARAVAMVKKKDADFWVGSYINEEPDVAYPAAANYFDADTVNAAIQPGNSNVITDESSLAGKNLGWVRGYAYDQYLDVEVNHEKLNDLTRGLKMVVAGRIDAVLDDSWEIDQAIKQSDIDPGQVTQVEVLDLPLYPAFHDSERGRELRDIYDRRLPELIESGRIQELYDQYDAYDQYRPGLAE